ncbi:MAG: hypothetical protein EPN79_11440 [Burkholderiaceae bacterium]|nr:MAG: hypothetical protein EPN79_11440 [Burkholderiaceae bacterium]TBR76701.1 MAG: hypothetical protein EPN64_05625 [Burkholderiaceae bacterium]
MIIDSPTGLGIEMARFPTFAVEFALSESPLDRKTYDDLFGPEIGKVMGHVGWHYKGMPIRIDALLDQKPVASAWAGAIRTRDKLEGVNISYAVGSAWRGKGLAALLSYCAVAELAAKSDFEVGGDNQGGFVNIQARDSNRASLFVAQTMGVPRCEDACFQVELQSGLVQYSGFREPMDSFLHRCVPLIHQRIHGYRPGQLKSERDLDEGSQQRYDEPTNNASAEAFRG